MVGLVSKGREKMTSEKDEAKSICQFVTDYTFNQVIYINGETDAERLS